MDGSRIKSIFTRDKKKEELKSLTVMLKTSIYDKNPLLSSKVNPGMRILSIYRENVESILSIAE